MAKDISHAADFVVWALEKKVKAEVSRSKSVVLASSKDLRDKLQEKIKGSETAPGSLGRNWELISTWVFLFCGLALF